MHTLPVEPMARHVFSSSGQSGPSLRFFKEIPSKEQQRMTQSQPFTSFSEDPARGAALTQSGNMASRLAHDLVNILTVIKGNTELAALHLPQGSSQQHYYTILLLRASEDTRFWNASQAACLTSRPS